MNNFSSPLLDAIAAVNESFKCDCEHRQLVFRTHKDNTEHFVLQCLQCGKTVHQAIPTSQAYALTGGVKPPPIDESRSRNWVEAKRKALKEAEAAALAPAEAEYNRYLASPQWAGKRTLVLKRAGAICEGCGGAKNLSANYFDNFERSLRGCFLSRSGSAGVIA